MLFLKKNNKISYQNKKKFYKSHFICKKLWI